MARWQKDFSHNGNGVVAYDWTADLSIKLITTYYYHDV